MASTVNSSENAAKTYTIEASVPTGFERVAAEEAKEMFRTDCRTIRGKITFQTPADRVKDILKLGGIDHCRARILHLPHFNFTDDGDDCLSRLQLLVKQCDWAEGLEVWKQFFTFPHPIPHTPPTIPTDQELIDVCHSIHMPGQGSTTSQGKKKGRKDRRKGGGRREKGGAERDRAGGQQNEGETEGQQKREAGGGNGAAMDATAEVEENGKLPEDSTQEKEGGDNEELNGLMSQSEPAKACGAEPELSESQVVGSAADSCAMKGHRTAEANSVQEEEDPDTSAQSPVKKPKNTGDGGEEAAATTSGRTDKTSAGQAGTLFAAANHAVSSTGDGNGAAPCVEEDVKSSADLWNHSNTAGDSSVAVHNSEEKDSSSQSGPAQKAKNGGEAPGKPDCGEMEASAQSSPAKQKARRPVDPTKPVFRVTCKRAGENHSFDSMSAASSFGSAMQTYFGWSVDMTRFNIEVMLTIDNGEVSVGLTLTPESLHRRNLVAFGVTTLRPTICYNMLRMVKIRPGHVVCDPLCGTASISIQGALSFPAFQLCGDNHNVAMEKTHSNHTALNAKRLKADKGALMMDGVQWNACHLPLREGVVDVFVSDLPFGKRVGKKFYNWKLYCNVLDEMARCGKLTARAALLTGDINNMVKAVQNQKYWTRRRCYSCNIGGIPATVFLLCRSPTPYSPRPHAHPQPHPSHRHHLPHPHPPPSSTDGPQQPADSSASSEQTEPQPSPVSPDQSEPQSIPSSSEQNGSQANGGELTGAAHD